MNKLLLLVALALLAPGGCKTKDPTPDPPKDPLSLLPPETETGAGTFGCLINGQAYIASTSISANGDWQSTTKLAIGSTMSLNGAAAGSTITILAALNGALQDNQNFSIISSATPFPVFTPGINQFYTHVAAIPCIYDGDYFKSGQIQLLHFDGVRRIASGRFAFKLYGPSGCDALRVTNGRFDVKF
ncbi:Riean_0653 family protein [Hymenobacter daeguensis]